MPIHRISNCLLIYIWCWIAMVLISLRMCGISSMFCVRISRIRFKQCKDSQLLVIISLCILCWPKWNSIPIIISLSTVSSPCYRVRIDHISCLNTWDRLCMGLWWKHLTQVPTTMTAPCSTTTPKCTHSSVPTTWATTLTYSKTINTNNYSPTSTDSSMQYVVLSLSSTVWLVTQLYSNSYVLYFRQYIVIKYMGCI